jgi:hypothetical protein
VIGSVAELKIPLKKNIFTLIVNRKYNTKLFILNAFLPGIWV